MKKQFRYKLLLMAGLVFVAQKSLYAKELDEKIKKIETSNDDSEKSGKVGSDANIKKQKLLSENSESKDDTESQSDFEKTIERIINARTTTLNDLKENSEQPYTQIIAQEIDMREKELESLNKILANTDAKSSELGSWISTETSTKTEDREELANELDIIKRIIKRRMIVVKKLEKENPRPFTQKIAEDVDFRREEIKLLRSRKQELMEALGVDNDTPSIKKEARRKLGRLSKKEGKKNKKKGKKNKEKKRARKNRKKDE